MLKSFIEFKDFFSKASDKSKHLSWNRFFPFLENFQITKTISWNILIIKWHNNKKKKLCKVQPETLQVIVAKSHRSVYFKNSLKPVWLRVHHGIDFTYIRRYNLLLAALPAIYRPGDSFFRYIAAAARRGHCVLK